MKYPKTGTFPQSYTFPQTGKFPQHPTPKPIANPFEYNPNMQNRFYRLPTELQSLIYTMDPTCRNQFDKVIDEMERLLSIHEELEFKPQYQQFFGSGAYVHSPPYQEHDGFYFIASIDMEGPMAGNGVTLRAHKIMKYLRLVLPAAREYPDRMTGGVFCQRLERNVAIQFPYG